MNSITRIIDEQENHEFHVVTNSSGNAVQALTLTATIMNIKFKVVMPEIAPETKKKRLLVMVRRCTSMKAPRKLVNLSKKESYGLPKK